MIKAYYIETYAGWDYFRDQHGNVYTQRGHEILYCSNHKRGGLDDDKAEPSYPVYDTELVYGKDVV